MSRLAHSRPALIGSIAAITCLVILNVSYWIVLPQAQRAEPIPTDSADSAYAAAQSAATLGDQAMVAGAILLVAVIFGLVLWLIFSRLQTKQSAERNRKRLDDLAALQKGLRTYFESKGHYPVAASDEQRQVPATDLGLGWEKFGFPAAEEMITYIPDWPLVDPQVTASDRSQRNQYLYYPLNNGADYLLYAHLEPEKGKTFTDYNQPDNLPTAWGEYNVKVSS